MRYYCTSDRIIKDLQKFQFLVPFKRVVRGWNAWDAHLKVCDGPSQVAQLVGASSCAPEGCGFDPG